MTDEQLNQFILELQQYTRKNEERHAQHEEWRSAHDERMRTHDEWRRAYEERSAQHEVSLAKLQEIADGQGERIQQNEKQLAEIKELNKQVAQTLKLFIEHAQIVEERLVALHEGQEHTDQRLDALIDIVQQKFGQ
jgi:hypothetical protein